MKKYFDFKFLRLLVSYFLVLCFLLGSGAFLYSSFNTMMENQNLVIQTGEVLGEIDLTLSGLKDAETGTRGFIISRKDEFLAPYYTGSIEAKSHAAELVKLTRDNPIQNERSRLLSNMIDERLKIFENMIELTRTPRAGYNVRIESYLQQGKFLMDQLRRHSQVMKDEERRLLRERTQAAEGSREFFIYALVASTILSVIILTVAFGQFRRAAVRSAKELVENQHQIWMRENMNEISKLTTGDLPLGQMGDQILNFLAKQLNILAGQVFLLEKGQPAMISSLGVGVHAVSGIKDSLKTLVSEAAKRQDVWQISEVPDEYWKIRSGLGESRPSNIIFVPIRFQGQPFGLIELASFEPLEPSKIEMLERLRDVLGVNLSAAQSRAHLHTLLEETQTQAEELQAQQEELRTNNEELEQQARALESQQEALSIKNRELEDSRRSIEAKARELEMASQYKSEFLAKMSHELRTPLNGLLILSSLLFENKEKNLSEQQRQFAKSIYNAGNDLLTLINDILDLSKIEARKLRLVTESFLLEPCLYQLKLVFEPQAQAKNIHFKFHLAPELAGVQIHTDRHRLEQVLRNFLSNAVKFTEKGTIELSAAYAAGSKDRISISVRDSGIGIPAQKKNLVFEAFEQADGSVSRRFGGTGLGLTISRELAHLLGGEITLESTEGIGSTFMLSIPLKLDVSQDERTLAPMMGVPLREAATGTETSTNHVPNTIHQEAQKRIADLKPGEKTLLIVEDDVKFRASVAEAARSYGYQPLEIEDGDLALAVLNKMVPDAILLDVKLPGISGMGLLEMIKTMPQLRHVPVHMISAMDYQLNALRLGALGYLTKPVTIEKVRSALDRIEHMLTSKVRRVLLIEDDDRQQDAISNLISGQDVTVLPAKNGREAMEILKKGGIDCIILDLTLPDVSGFDLLNELGTLQISLPPIVIYTGKDLTADEEDRLRQYSQSIIIKGARSPERLLDEVNLFLHRVESLLPKEKRDMLSRLRSQDKTFENKNILLVDDDLRNLFALTSALEGRGLAVKTAKNGIEALEALRDGTIYDLVLMDIMMPKMDGFEAMRQIRSDKNTLVKDVPIIALTAKAMREDHEKCIEAGASDYLTKPVNLDNLFTAMKVWLSQRDSI